MSRISPFLPRQMISKGLLQFSTLRNSGEKPMLRWPTIHKIQFHSFLKLLAIKYIYLHKRKMEGKSNESKESKSIATNHNDHLIKSKNKIKINLYSHPAKTIKKI